MCGTLKDLTTSNNLNNNMYSKFLEHLINQLITQLKWLSNNFCLYFDIKDANIMYRCTNTLISFHIVDIGSCDHTLCAYPPPETIDSSIKFQPFGNNDPRNINKKLVESDKDFAYSYMSYMLGITILKMIIDSTKQKSDMDFMNKFYYEDILENDNKDPIFDRTKTFCLFNHKTNTKINDIIDSLSIDQTIKNMLKEMIIGDLTKIRMIGKHLYVPRYKI
jgi:hypothetical protein